VGRPSYDPDSELSPAELVSTQYGNPTTKSLNDLPVSGCSTLPFYPFPNYTQYALSNHYLNAPSGQRSAADFDRLLALVSDPRFCPEDVHKFRHRHMQKLLDEVDKTDGTGPLSGDDGWKRDVCVTIQVPEGKKWWTTSSGRSFSIPGLCHRSIMAIVHQVYSTAMNLHFTPFELIYQPTKDVPPMRVWGDIFSSPMFVDAHKKLPKIPGCEAERVIAPLMVWSDSTHLTNFGTAKLWPIYMFFGSQDKRLRVKPTAHVCHHLAYIPSVSMGRLSNLNIYSHGLSF
jgi:Plavaka transposase